MEVAKAFVNARPSTLSQNAIKRDEIAARGGSMGSRRFKPR
jgi:hypothetical protein